MNSTSGVCLRPTASPFRISSEDVRRRTNHLPLTGIIRSSSLEFFGYIVRADPFMDHSRALGANFASLLID